LELYLIRHGKPNSKPNHWISSSTPLSSEGVIQAEKIGLKLTNIPFDKIITSPFTRSKETAEIIRQKSQQSDVLKEEQWLSEIDIGKWAGLNKNIIIQECPTSVYNTIQKGYIRGGPLVARLLKSQKDFCFPKGEDLKSFWNRVSTGLLQILDQYRGRLDKKIALVGHGGSFTIIILKLLGYSFRDINFPIFIFGLGDTTIIRIRDEQIYYLSMNSFYLPTDNCVD